MTEAATPDKSQQASTFSGLSLVKNAISAFMGTFLVSIIGFFLTPFMVHQLGNNRFGVWTLIYSIVVFTELADFGIGMGIQRYVAQYVAQNTLHKITTLTNQAYTMVTLSVALASIPLFLVAVAAPSVFHIPGELLGEAQKAMGLLIISMLIYIPLSVFSGVITGYQKYDLLNLNWFGISMLRAAAFVGCVFLPKPLIALAFSLIVLAAFRFFTLLRIVQKLNPGYRFAFSWPDTQFFKKVAVYSGGLFAVSILGRITYTTDTMIIGMLLPASAITFYAIGAKWSEIFRIMLSSAIQVCFPAFAHLNTLDDKENIRRILLHGSRTAVGFGVLGASLLILMAAPIITLWVGPKFEPSIVITRWLGMVGVFTCFLFPFEHYLKAVGEVKRLFQAVLFNCITNLVASVFLIKAVGLVGAVWGTLAGVIPTAMILVIPTACRHAGISFGALLKQLIIPLLLPMLWMVGFGVWFHFYPPKLQTLWDLLSWSSLITAGYMALWMLFDPIPRKLLKYLKR